MAKKDYDLRVVQEAYRQFKKQYTGDYPLPTRRTPPAAPVKRTVTPPEDMRSFARNPLAWVLIIISFAAAWLSALRTMAVFEATGGSTTEGRLAVLVVEGSALFLALFQVLEAYQRDHKLPSSGTVNNSVKGIVSMAILMGLITNTYDIFLRQNQHYSSLTLAVFLLAGSIATITLAVLGHALGVIYVWDLHKRREADGEYSKALSHIEEEQRTDLEQYQYALDEIERVYQEDITTYNQRLEEAWKLAEPNWVNWTGNTIESRNRTNERTERLDRTTEQPNEQTYTPSAFAQPVQSFAEQPVHVFGQTIQPTPQTFQMGMARPLGDKVNALINVLLDHPDILAQSSMDAMLQYPEVRALVSSKGETLSKAVKYARSVQSLNNDQPNENQSGDSIDSQG